MKSKILALMMLTAIIVAVLAAAAGHAQNLEPSTARLCNGLPYLCEKRFDEVTFPGNHNAGSGADGALRWCCTGALYPPCAVRNQGKTITQQLEFGIRYFDIDLHICGNELVTGHGYADKVGNTCPIIGPRISDMLQEFDDFLNDELEENRNEVIVLTFGDQHDKPGGNHLQKMLYNQLKGWTEQSKENGKATIFKKNPADFSWPTLGDLVDKNQRIVVFLRNPGLDINLEIDPDFVRDFEEIGVLSERDHIFDTWISRSVRTSCYGVVPDTYNKCLEAFNEEHPDKLVLVSVFASSGLCLSEAAFLCQRHLLASLDVGRCALSGLDFDCNDTVVWTGEERIPNFITADWTQNGIKASGTVWPVSAHIVNVVKYFNQKILKEEQENALVISNDAASHIGFESNRNGKMISAGIEFKTHKFTDNELWKYKEYTWDEGLDNPRNLENLKYGEEICLQSKSNGKYLRAWKDTWHNGLYQSDWCHGDEKWTIEKYIKKDDNTEGFVQAGDPICLRSRHGRYVQALDHRLTLGWGCGTDEKFYVHAGWNDSDEDRVIDGGDNCPNRYNPAQKDTDEDGRGDACDFALPFLWLLF